MIEQVERCVGFVLGRDMACWSVRTQAGYKGCVLGDGCDAKQRLACWSRVLEAEVAWFGGKSKKEKENSPGLARWNFNSLNAHKIAS